ncbi:endonuclease/exonuclease/phosphatase family protein [Dictyobacter kobayashii]|uniref:Endonuclease/exonuclease/phosphatase domain-containing protein n=1 Tax=Dictyobacter kobayashii TaxID=2014872 RepID=A0A402AD09_9CHLR|nr:endonuclease/exonuclease/phosphatase family protein [Dictyobacter kobayashii]GCE16966.1 hypothetical protein KDK_07660 [Dictyobacter kobayashii]
MVGNWFLRVWQKQRFKTLIIGTLCYLLVVDIIIVAHVFVPQREGILALLAIFAPYLFIPLLILIPFLLWRFTSVLRVVFVLGIVLFCLWFPPRLGNGGAQESATGQTVTALTWNYRGRNKRDGYLRQIIDEKDPGIIALQEADWSGIDLATDILQAYPYHLYQPNDVPPGEALLSKYPIVDHGILQASDGSRTVWDIPRVLWVRLDLGHGRTMLVVNAHPISAVNTVYGCLYCPQRRDNQVKELHQFLQPLLTRGERLLLLGDMNLTDRELAYHDLASGLEDTQLQVGSGSGESWGINSLNRVWAVFRIDYMFVSPNIKPLNLDTDCVSRGSQHCILIGQFSV